MTKMKIEENKFLIEIKKQLIHTTKLLKLTKVN